MNSKFRMFLKICVVLPLLSMMFFEANAVEFNLQHAPQYFEAAAYGNNLYQFEIWSAWMENPLNAFGMLFRNGPMYLCFVLSQFIPLKSFYVPEYPQFSLELLGKILGLYFLPMLLYWVWPKSKGKLCAESLD